MSLSARVLFLLACSAAMSLAQAAALTSGPMLGHATSRTASIWLQGDGPGEVQIEYWLEQGPRSRVLSPPLRLEAATDFSARIELTGLIPDSHYRYTVFLDGERVRDDASLRLRTLPIKSKRSQPLDFTVYLGSCAYLDDPAAERPSGGEEIFARIAAAAASNTQPNLMLWLGDNLYFRDSDHESPWGMNARYRATRAHPALQSLLRATRHYATWDDHDYGPNDGNRSFEFKAESAALFQRYWANPSYGLTELPGVFTRFAFLDADFFLLDGRTYRAADKTVEPNVENSFWQGIKDWAIGSNQWSRLLGKKYLSSNAAWLGENKILFGPAQLDWLKQALIGSTAPFKIVVSGSQLFNDANTFEGWQNFKPEREAFVEWLDRQKIPGVLFLSGDRHHTELIRRERKDGYPLFELTCSPLSAGAGIPEDEKENAQRVEGTLVEQRNFCALEIMGRQGDRALSLRAHDSQGRVLWEKRLTATELSEAEEED